MQAAGAGLIIEPASAEELAAAVRRLADDPDGAKAFGQQGCDYVCANFDRRVSAARYIDVLRAAIALHT